LFLRMFVVSESGSHSLGRSALRFPCETGSCFWATCYRVECPA
jgi:hypothetical protein